MSLTPHECSILALVKQSPDFYFEEKIDRLLVRSNDKVRNFIKMEWKKSKGDCRWNCNSLRTKVLF